MKKIDLSNYGPVIGSKTIGDEIYKFIDNELRTNDKVIVDVSAIKSMATFCAKQIFGRLYVELGSESFYEKIAIQGADEDIKTIIQIGIQHALADKK